MWQQLVKRTNKTNNRRKQKIQIQHRDGDVHIYTKGKDAFLNRDYKV